MRAQSVTQRAVDAELKLSELRRLGIACQRILGIGRVRGDSQKHDSDAPSSEHEFTFQELAAFYPIDSRLQLWKSRDIRE
jgi:hypothetical protein